MVPDLFISFNPADRHDRQGRFIILSGPSGVGKNTLLNRVLHGVSGVYYIPSATTRPMRPGETQLNPYVFMSVPEFEDLIEQGKFLEWKKIHSQNYYGTHKPTIDYAIANGYDIITDMDVLGCEDAREAFPDHIRTIFIRPPSLDELSHRLMERDGDANAVAARLKRVPLELDHSHKYHFSLVNDDLEESARALQAIVLSIIDANAAIRTARGTAGE
ncbi:MAG: guanylate kinase [Firmicutes bacterium]|nr:guanylate kinase [Bacillota bacterium]